MINAGFESIKTTDNRVVRVWFELVPKDIYQKSGQYASYLNQREISTSMLGMKGNASKSGLSVVTWKRTPKLTGHGVEIIM